MPFARWIKNKNDRLVCVWNDDMKLSSLHTSEISLFVQSGEVVAMKAPFAKAENTDPVYAKQALSDCCKLAA